MQSNCRWQSWLAADGSPGTAGVIQNLTPFAGERPGIGTINLPFRYGTQLNYGTHLNQNSPGWRGSSTAGGGGGSGSVGIGSIRTRAFGPCWDDSIVMTGICRGRLFG